MLENVDPLKPKLFLGKGQVQQNFGPANIHKVLVLSCCGIGKSLKSQIFHGMGKPFPTQLERDVPQIPGEEEKPSLGLKKKNQPEP